MQCHSDKGSLRQTPHLTLFSKVVATVAYKTEQGTTGQEIIHVFKQILNVRKQEMINVKVHKIVVRCLINPCWVLLDVRSLGAPLQKKGW